MDLFMKNYFKLLYLLIICGSLRATSNTLSIHDIREIYALHVKPYTDHPKFNNRYVPLPLRKNNSSWHWKDKDFPRVLALLEFERFVVENKITCNKGLAINGLDPEWYYLPSNEIREIIYDGTKQEYDLHTLNLPEIDFDFVMVNQTLEHVYDPIRCLKNIYAHMCSGGILYLNVPVNSIPHETPFHHYTGFTPTGLGAIAAAAGFKILSIGQWGNLEYLMKMHTSQSWPDYRQLKQPGLNEINYPVITWIFALKE
jgi:SAM-dependent methyltransferase